MSLLSNFAIMDTNSTAAIKESINDFRRISSKAAISPDSLGALLEALRKAVADIESAAASDGRLDDAISSLNELSKSVSVISPTGVPGHCPHLNSQGLLPESTLPADRLFALAMPWLWELMTRDSLRYQPLINAPQGISPNPLLNGYYPELHQQRPYFLHCGFYSTQQAAQILFDRWVPGLEGVMQNARANIPQPLKDTDSRISLAYTATNNWRPITIALGPFGVRSRLCPTSVYRAFHGAGDLHMVIGTISLERISSQYEVKNAFIGCPNLRFFLLENIPDCISEIDLSGCSPDIVSPLKFDDANDGNASRSFCPVEYLLRNIDHPDNGFSRDPDAPLSIILPQAAQQAFIQSSSLRSALSAASVRHLNLSLPGISD